MNLKQNILINILGLGALIGSDAIGFEFQCDERAPQVAFAADKVREELNAAGQKDAAMGNAKTNLPIPGFQSKQDCSDAGSHSFASIPAAISAVWETRNNIETPMSYMEHRITGMTTDMVTEQ